MKVKFRKIKALKGEPKKLAFLGLFVAGLIGGLWYYQLNIIDQEALVLLDKGDKLPPSVDLTQPDSSDEIIAGEKTSVKASASDNVRVASVEFSVDGAVLDRVKKPPFQADWQPAHPGTYQVAVVAKDGAGNKSAPDYVLVEVEPTLEDQASSTKSGGK